MRYELMLVLQDGCVPMRFTGRDRSPSEDYRTAYVLVRVTRLHILYSYEVHSPCEIYNTAYVPVRLTG
jgi:hypothetical protein